MKIQVFHSLKEPIQFYKSIGLKKMIIFRFILLIIKGQHSERSERGIADLINKTAFGLAIWAAAKADSTA